MNFNFIHKDTSQRDFDSLFGPIEPGDVFIPFTDDDRIERLVVDHIGKFKSFTQARKNGWNGPIPMGFKRHKISKTFFYTYRPLPLEPDENPEDHIPVVLPS